MNKLFAFFYIILVLLLSGCSKHKSQSRQEVNFDGTISISGAFALYPLAVKWSEEYRKIHSNVKIDISAGGTGKGITDALSRMVDIGMVSRKLNPEEQKKGAYSIAVARDAVLATVNTSNPLLKPLLDQGLTKSLAADIWVSGKYKTWGEAFGVISSAPLHVYTRSDAAGASESWALYLDKKQEDLLGVGVFGDPGLVQAIIKDPYAIGYNNIGYVYDLHTRHLIPGIQVLPIDLNNNGKIDPEEDFYGNLDLLTNAIASGKYPSPPARDLYLVSNGKPKNKVVINFIKWILTDGQKYVNSAGFVALPNAVLLDEYKK